MSDTTKPSPSVVYPARSGAGKRAWLAAGIMLIVCGLFATNIFLIQARSAVAEIERSTAISGIAQGMAIAEQGGVHFDESSDWKKILIEAGYVTEDMFRNQAAVGGVIHYRIIWRPETTSTWIGTSSSWLCIYEDPASLRREELVRVLSPDGNLSTVDRSVLFSTIQQQLKAIGVDRSERELRELSGR